MKSLYIKSAIATAALLTSSSAYAAEATGNASATVVAPLAVSETTPMSFGAFTANGISGTVSTGGAFDGGVTVIVPPTPATFTVTGAPNQGYTINGSPSVTLTNGTPANDMTANLFRPTSDTLGAGGTDTFNVNGTLNVAANQPAGLYTGTYLVNVNY